jgi:hypothetical protein
MPQQAAPPAPPAGGQPANGAAPARTPEYLSYKRAVESGFLAGFSERFAQDIVTQGKTAAGGAGAAASRTPAAAR